MESTCGGPMRHLGARGQVKVKGLIKKTLIERFKIKRNDSSKPLFAEKKNDRETKVRCENIFPR